MNSHGKPLALLLGSGIHGDIRALELGYWWPYSCLEDILPSDMCTDMRADARCRHEFGGHAPLENARRGGQKEHRQALEMPSAMPI